MKISFKTSEDKLKCEIFHNETYIGYVYLNVWSQKWLMKPNFNLTYSFSNAEKDKFHSSYEAGKAMAELYNFIFPDIDEEYNTQEFGIGLGEMLTYLKARI